VFVDADFRITFGQQRIAEGDHRREHLVQPLTRGQRETR